MTTLPPDNPSAPEPAPPGRSRSRLPLIGVGLLVVLGCIAVSTVAAVLLLRARSQGSDHPAVAYIMDISPRMGDSAGTDTKLAIGRSIFADVIRRSDPDLTAGFRVFGVEAGGAACDDTELLVPFAQSNQNRIADRLGGLDVGGSSESALGAAMIAAVRDLSQASGKRYMVVVTGGSDSCNPEAGRLIAAEAADHDIDLQTFVVGFQVSPAEADALRRIAKQGGASYLEAANEEQLRRALESVQGLIEQGTPIEQPLAVVATTAPASSTESPTRPPQPTEAVAAASDYTSQTACDHPYFPLRQGAHWDYSYDGLPASWDVTDVTGDLDSASATVVIAVEGLTITYHWDCGADGVFFYQFGSFDFSELPGDVQTTLTSQSGSPIPPAGSLVPGASWTSSYTMEISFEMEGIALTITNQVDQSYAAGDFEQHSTAAGSIEALRIENTGSTTTTTFGTTVNSSSNGTCWFAIGIGWLGCDTSSDGDSSHSELVSYSIP